MNAPLLTGSPIWMAAGWTMLHLIWVGVAIGLCAALTRRLLRAAHPQARYGVALAWLMALSVSPAMIFVWVFEPDSRVEIAMARAVTISQSASPNTSVNPDRPRPEFHRSAAVDTLASDVRRSRLDLLVPYLPWFWLVGSLSTLGMLATGLIGVEQLRRNSRTVEVGDLRVRCRSLAASLGIVRRVGIGICDRLAGPILVGIIRPMILLPPAALSGWSIDQVEMVLLHELAHLRRLDNLVNLMQRIVESLLFFHPVVWWLSAWVRLESELCCDRLVVERSGQAHAYVEMLVTLSGSGPGSGRPVPAMAERQVMTRIRRLLNLEDRSMKLTMPEGLGVLVAVIVGMSLALGLQAAPPRPTGESDESIRQTLRKMSDDVKEVPQDGLKDDVKVMTFTDIAQAQIKLGDRASALVTLQRAFDSIDHFEPKKGDIELIATLPQIAKYQREAGDLAAARATLVRMSKLVDSLKDFSRVEELIQLTGVAQPQREKHEVGAMICSELCVVIADEWLALGDRDEARLLYQRALGIIQAQTDVLKPMFLAGISGSLYKAGDTARARDAIEQARRAASTFTKLEDREGTLPYVAEALAEIGDLDGALKLVQTLGKYGKPSALRLILGSFADDDFHGAWLDNAGIKILIGGDSMKVKDPPATIQAMPKIARAVLEIDDSLLQVRTLAMISNLQAQAGDFAGARRTADSIPNIKRADFPEPSDGFYDSVKPGTLAINARLQAKAGDQAGAREGFRHAIALSKSIENAGQKIVAQIVTIQKQIDCNELDAAKALVREVIPFALVQTEPLRSRSLAMLVECQVKAGIAAEAPGTIDAIRDFPGLEKVRALNILADWHEKAGYSTSAKRFYEQALKCVEAKAPKNAPDLNGKVKRQIAVAARTFVDFEYEIEPARFEHQKQMQAMFLRARLTDAGEAVRATQGMAAAARGVALGNLAGSLARQGNVAGALELARSFEPQERLMALALTACAIRDGDVHK